VFRSTAWSTGHWQRILACRSASGDFELAFFSSLRLQQGADGDASAVVRRFGGASHVPASPGDAPHLSMIRVVSRPWVRNALPLRWRNCSTIFYADARTIG
jgi:hypothetical protein